MGLSDLLIEVMILSCLSEEGKELPIPPSIPAFPDNGLDSLSSEREGSNGNGIWIGIGIGAALVLLVIVSVVFLKM